jgi:hypothetical protein
VNLSPLPIQKFFDNAGRPLNGGLLFTYVAATTTKLATYQDQAGTPNTNPIVLNFRGEANIWLDQTLTYKFVLAPSTDTDPPTNPIWTVDNISAGITFASLTAAIIGRLIWPPTPVEIATLGPSLTGLNVAYEWADVRRFGAICDGVTDDTVALNRAATVARAAYATSGGQNFIEFKGPGPCLVSASLNFSLIDVYAHGEWKHIQATSAQFNVITTTGSTRIFSLRVDGGWDGVTAGQNGNILSATATAPAFPYQIELSSCIFINAKRCHIYIERSGYTSLHRMQCTGAGLHSLQIQGYDLAGNPATTVTTSGSCQWGSTPNGYGIWIEYGANLVFTADIVESTKGIWIGGDNRSLTFRGVYQENTSGGKYLDWSTSSGIGLSVSGAFGGGASVAYNGSWQDVYFDGGNSNFGDPAVPFANRIKQVDSGQITTAVHGALSVTVASVSLPSGTWVITGTLQTADAGAANLQDASFVLTTDVSNSGAASGTSTFEVGTARVYAVPSGSTARLSAATIYQNQTAAPVTYYMRGFFNNSAGTLAYRGEINAVKFQ